METVMGLNLICGTGVPARTMLKTHGQHGCAIVGMSEKVKGATGGGAP
jgi:hypothetical protein